ncbi:MAG TPA: hypothetical protein DCS07_01760 [Bdellovibrionales bacterium]|nr:MAG: hypothetical protein A2X97_12485 [Bdellovibrionales bacterium GWA1_52_35]HAR41350.1 hypothetical protein [Bdellovibrionales bacterium]HCM39750.1 hypothetical protein [Bdellovibrionales bacterium]
MIDALGHDVKAIDQHLFSDAIVESAVKVVRDLKLPIASSVVRQKLSTIIKSAKGKGLSLSGYSVSIFAGASLGIGPHGGYELVVLTNPNQPDSWEIGVFRFGGVLLGPKAEATGGVGLNLIFNMRKLKDYAGHFCGMSGGVSATLGLDAVMQTSCSTHSKNKIVTIGVATNLGFSAGIAGSYTHFRQESRVEMKGADVSGSIQRLVKGSAR